MVDEGVVVGVDGGEPSLAALRWAATTAALRGTPLRVLLAYHWRMPAALAPRGGPAETARRLADMFVADVAGEARAAAPGVDVRAEAVPGHPADVLLRAAAGADLLVVGTRGRHRAAGAVLGSVSQQVAMHSACPVAVVRGRPDPDGGVLVGVDDSASAVAALRLAFAEAGRRGADLVAVRAIETPLAPPALGLPPLLYDIAEAGRAMSAEAATRVGEEARRHHGVPWEFHGVAGDAGEMLCERSARARLVVVGSRGHGGVAGLLLGSVGLRLLQHSDCPVLVTHATTGPGAEP
ncbi:universal stress protein [Dactylosporangium sp. NPDC049140]|uniref:universal stress protein n=1 Tax=Dactylosporangium sp. NPDC049140 TaxID=3155647 RepID=UPI0033E5F95B